MGLFNIGESGTWYSMDFALGLPKHDLGWPLLRPLCRDTTIEDQDILIKRGLYISEMFASENQSDSFDGEKLDFFPWV